MTLSTLNLTPALHQYLLTTSAREHPLLAELRERTIKDDHARFQIAQEQGQLMGLLVKLMGAKRIVEIGTFTGYSSLVMGMAMPDEGRILCCDLDKQWTDVAQDYWRRAGIAHKMQLELAPAADTLNQLLIQGEARTFDMAFIDADKANYDQYYELCLRLLRPGGLLMIDNTLWGGSVIDMTKQDADTRAIRQLNKKLQSDPRIEISHLPIADGLTLCLKN